MKNILKYAIAATASVAVLASCDLNLLPSSSIAYDESGVLIQTQSNLTSFENGILASYRGLQQGVYFMAEEAQLDCYNATVDYGNNYGALHRTDMTFTSTNYDTEDMWSGSYPAIKNFNIIIANADKCPEDIYDNAQVVLGEAYFFRAATYLQLARHFGKAYGSTSSSDLCVPLVLKYDQNELPARATVSEVYTQIGLDLAEAAKLLANVKGAVRSIKPTIDAVNALYARYYLDMKDYTNAALYAHKVIDTKTYALASDAEAFETEYVNDGGTEPIMQMYASKTEGSNGNSDWTLETTDSTYGNIFRPYYIPTKTVIESYDEGDLRFGLWFDNTVAVQISGSYYNNDDTPDFYTFVKFRGNPDLTTSPIRNGRQLPKPFKIGEMYLIAAEAECTSNPTAAKSDLNALQAARCATLTDATMANIQKEWLRETIGEGMRLTCLKRWGLGFNGREPQDGAENIIMTGANFEQKVFDASSNYFQWPVPSHEMKINQNLVQNPGYDGN